MKLRFMKKRPENLKKIKSMQQALQVRVISLEQPQDLIYKLKTIFPGTDIGIQKGVDLQSISVENLYHSGIITHSVVKTLTLGRKWHHEIPSKGAIGLSQAVKLAISEKSNLSPKSLLLFEDDCIIKNDTNFTKNVEHLLNYQDQFDLAVFGALLVGINKNPPCPFMDEGWYYLKDGDFFLTHSVLYTPNARRILKQHFDHNPIEMQIDGLYSSMAHLGMLRILVQLDHSDTVQSTHISNVQELGGCKLCFMFSFIDNNNYYIQVLIILFIIWFMIMLTYSACINTNKKWKIFQNVESDYKSVHLYSRVNIEK